MAIIFNRTKTSDITLQSIAIHCLRKCQFGIDFGEKNCLGPYALFSWYCNEKCNKSINVITDRWGGEEQWSIGASPNDQACDQSTQCLPQPPTIRK